MDEDKFRGLLAKVEKLKTTGDVDLSTAEDLSLAVMNLISLEEHFFFTGAKTGKGEYYDLSTEARALRKDLLAKLVGDHEGETWCASKHLLAATMRLIEVGNREQADGNKEVARKTFAQAYRVYAIFWALRLKLLDLKKLPERVADQKPWTVEELVTKLADCCRE